MSDTNSVGVCFNDKKLIMINSDLSKDEFNQTLIHELGHAMFHAIGLHQTSIGYNLEEIIVENFSKIVVEKFNVKLKGYEYKSLKNRRQSK